jgi:ATP-dependent DNA helicase RecG
VLCESSDGFHIAEEDLRLRGPGELLGKRQHGLPAFRVANLLTDLDLLEQARDDASRLLRDDCNLQQREHTGIKNRVLERYGEFLDLLDVA